MKTKPERGRTRAAAAFVTVLAIATRVSARQSIVRSERDQRRAREDKYRFGVHFVVYSYFNARPRARTIMGMDAEFFVNGERVDSYKCTGRWSDIVDVRYCPALTVRYRYERGYGHYTLFVYFRHVATGMLETENVNVTGCDRVVSVPAEWLEYIDDDDEERERKVEVFVCMKGELYAHDGPLFVSEQSKWYSRDLKHVRIRDSPLDAARRIECASDVFEFVKAFMRIEEGEYAWQDPLPIDKLDDQELASIKKVFASTVWNHYDKVNAPPIVTFAENYLMKLT
ncbi:host range factor-1 [Olene mendosa nucleopolyhedrovirus]|uniref:Host range factor-1 n=1 Tax=Olene mendosa nucleopolyhedrovirus TaxID=2933796 RepID=A0AAX3AUT1_9ABAC|nr:host range factor-1 [Olene mendosa nucleopolyhedrovirus]UOQ18841.1 host range factor-1 [Olene mendosa nucleopolyhedrovirus]